MWDWPEATFLTLLDLCHRVCPSVRVFSCLSGAQSEFGQSWRNDLSGHFSSGDAWGAHSWTGPRAPLGEPLWGPLII